MMNATQRARLEHSERLIAGHCYLMRKPESKYKRVVKKLQVMVSRLDSQLGKLFDILNSSVQP